MISKSERKAALLWQYMAPVVSIAIPVVGLSVLAAGCLSLPPDAPKKTAVEVFEPDPGVLSDMDGLTVSVEVLDGLTVCFASNALVSDDGSSCTFGEEIISHSFDLTACVADQTVVISYIGNNNTPTTLSGSYDTSGLGTCDDDSDTVINMDDNCPNTANADQSNIDEDAFGDVCDDNIDGDAFGNAPEDNCEFQADDTNVCDSSSIPDVDNDGLDDTTIDKCVGVYNPSNTDADGDGIGDHCDETPTIVVLPYANPSFAQAFIRWKDQVQCDIRCTDPAGGGDMGTLNCPNGGTVNWTVYVGIGTADSYFTYTNCDYTTDEGDQLTVNGQLVQYSDWGGNGNEQGTVQVTGGDYTGEVTSHINFANRTRNSGYLTVACSVDPLVDEECAANNQGFDIYYPSWECQGTACDGAPPLPNSDGDVVADLFDNCVDVTNPAQADEDFDGIGDACDDSTGPIEDMDGDGIPDAIDSCPNVADTTNDPGMCNSYIFVTSSTHNGNLGGLSGADGICQTQATDAGLSGTYKAWLSDSSTSAASRLTHSSVPYITPDGAVVANDWSDFTDGDGPNVVWMHADGSAPNPHSGRGALGSYYIWSNTSLDGSIADPHPITPDLEQSCADWTSSTANGFGANGSTVLESMHPGMNDQRPGSWTHDVWDDGAGGASHGVFYCLGADVYFGPYGYAEWGHRLLCLQQ